MANLHVGSTDHYDNVYYMGSTHPIPWKLYSPPSSTLLPSKISQPVWSRLSRTMKKSITSQSSHLRTRSKDWRPPSKGILKHTSVLQTGMYVTPYTPTSRSPWAKELMQRPTGLPQHTMDMSKPTDKSKDHWTHPTHSPSMPGQFTYPSPSTLSPPGSTNYSLVPPLFMLTSPKQPTNLMTGASLRISHATANWTTTCPVSMQNSKGLRPKQGRLGS